MKVTETGLQGCFIIEPKVFEDERGYFMESFNAKKFNEAVGHPVNFVQDNQSFSTQGVLRGLHYQVGEYAQAKLVRVLDGSVLDVVVDIRENSPTFRKHEAVALSSENKKQLFIPKGFAHGFVVMSERATFFYKCDNYYNKASEGGIHYADPELEINWKLSGQHLIISEKDAVLPTLDKARL